MTNSEEAGEVFDSNYGAAIDRMTDCIAAKGYLTTLTKEDLGDAHDLFRHFHGKPKPLDYKYTDVNRNQIFYGLQTCAEDQVFTGLAERAPELIQSNDVVVK